MVHLLLGSNALWQQYGWVLPSIRPYKLFYGKLNSAVRTLKLNNPAITLCLMISHSRCQTHPVQMFQSASWQTINPISLLCDDSLDLSLHLNGIVYSSTIQLQEELFSSGKCSNSLLQRNKKTYSQNYRFFSFQ